MTKQAKNDNLHKAKTAKNDEFYTTKESIETELKHYWDHFRGKIIYCNCDDPYESEFFKYFMIRFNLLGLKGLYATCYEGSQVSQHQLQVFDDEDYRGIPYSIQIYKEDIDELLEEYGFLSQETIQRYIKTHRKAERLKGDGGFDSPECIELLEESDIVVTNEPFSLMRAFVALMMEYDKQFLIIGNMNAITYKEIFPLIKDNRLWLGYTHPKEFIEPNGTIKKFGNIMWFTNLDIPKRHEDLIVWKKYSPEEYPRYDNYDAINVDKVAEIPCDYCESWGLYPEEFEALNKAQWEEVRREHKEDTELIYVIPAKGTELRQALHEHSEGYKEEIEAELANTIYCSGCMGVPITVTDKLNPEQFEIIDANEIRKSNSIPKKTHGLIKDKDGSIMQKALDKCTPVGTRLSDSSTARQLDSSTARQLDSSTARQLDSSTARQLDSSTARQLDSSTARQLDSSTARQLDSSTNCLCSNRTPQGTVTELLESQSRSLTSGMSNNSMFSETNTRSTLKREEDTSKENVCIAESLSARHCNGMMGVPITFVDKLNPKQFRLIGQGQGNLYRQLTPYGLSQQFVDDYYTSGQKGSIKENHPVLGYYNSNHKPIIPYMRIVIQKIV